MYAAASSPVRGNIQISLYNIPPAGDMVALTDIYTWPVGVADITGLNLALGFGSESGSGIVWPSGLLEFHVELKVATGPNAEPGDMTILSSGTYSFNPENLQNFNYPNGAAIVSLDFPLASEDIPEYAPYVYPLLVVDGFTPTAEPPEEGLFPWLDCFGELEIMSDAPLSPAVDEDLMADLRALYAELVTDPSVPNDRAIDVLAPDVSVAANGERSTTLTSVGTVYGMVKYLPESAATRALGRPTGERVVEITIPYSTDNPEEHVYQLDGVNYYPIPGDNNMATSYRANTRFRARARS